MDKPGALEHVEGFGTVLLDDCFLFFFILIRHFKCMVSSTGAVGTREVEGAVDNLCFILFFEIASSTVITWVDSSLICSVL